MTMIFEQIAVGGKRNVICLFGDETELAAVDVGFQPELILHRVRQLGIPLKHIFATHGHRDLIGGAPMVQQATGAQIAAFDSPQADFRLKDGDTLYVGAATAEVLHTPDSVCFLVQGKKLLTGDTMYVGKVPGAKHCNAREAQSFYDSIRRLMQLEPEIEVFPGHDVGQSPSSTIGRELGENSCVA